jgi:hypothetical protein
MKNSELGTLVEGIGKAVNEKLTMTEKIVNFKFNILVGLIFLLIFIMVFMFKIMIETQTKLDVYMHEYGPTSTDIFIMAEPRYSQQHKNK